MKKNFATHIYVYAKKLSKIKNQKCYAVKRYVVSYCENNILNFKPVRYFFFKRFNKELFKILLFEVAIFFTELYKCKLTKRALQFL